ncbi:MAG TPA: HAD family hydrolase [Blastocatellia bacterium]|nr:HAD family hydrolase [Blastocatellia bacterium]
MRKHFDIVTFDCYGTLIDWESGIFNAFQTGIPGAKLERATLIEAYHQIEPKLETGEYIPYRDVLDRAAALVASRLGLEIPKGDQRFLSASIGSWPPFPDTNPALLRLATTFQLGILSNVDDDLLRYTLRHLKVIFNPIVTAKQVHSYKPAHAHFRQARRRTTPKRLLHAAQSYYHDVVPAKRLEIPVVWVNRKGEKAPRTGPLPDLEVKNLEELADLLGV